MLLNIPQCTEQPLTTKNYRAQNVNSADLRNPALTKYLIDGHLKHHNHYQKRKFFVNQPLSFVESFKTL